MVYAFLSRVFPICGTFASAQFIHFNVIPFICMKSNIEEIRTIACNKRLLLIRDRPSLMAVSTADSRTDARDYIEY